MDIPGQVFEISFLPPTAFGLAGGLLPYFPALWERHYEANKEIGRQTHTEESLYRDRQSPIASHRHLSGSTEVFGDRLQLAIMQTHQ